MKASTIAVALLLASLATSTAHADSRIHVGIDLHPRHVVPGYVAPVPHVHVVAPHGYWQDVTVKMWIPGHWNTGRDRWGRPVRFFAPGRFGYTADRIWVDGRHDNHRRDRPHERQDRHDRGRRWGR